MNNTLEHKGYLGTVEFSPEDKVFFGKLFGINDIVTFEGESVKELEQAFRDAVEEYIQTCKDLNKPPEKPYSGSFNVRVSPELHKKAAFLARKKNLTLNNFINIALDYIVKHEKEIEPELDVQPKSKKVRVHA
jgi:predicted HicB family RNase H-like nuclease